MKKSTIILSLLFVFAVLLRISHLNAAYVGDETYFPELVKYQVNNGLSLKFDSYETGEGYWLDLPLTGFIYSAYSFISGLGVINLRFLSFIIGLINLFLVYILAKKLFDEKTALISVFLMAVSYWHLFASYMIERDGSFLMLFYLTASLSYLKFKESKKFIWLYLASFICGISLLLKSSAVFISAMLFFFVIYDNRKKLWSSKREILIAFSSIAFFDIFFYGGWLLFSYFFAKDYYFSMFTHAIPLNYLSFSVLSVLREFGYILLWGSPLLFGLTLLSIKNHQKTQKSRSYLLIWLLVIIIGYTSITYGGAIDRYLSVLIPVLSILSASFISYVKFTKNQIKFGAIFSILFFILLNAISSIKQEYIYHSLKQYMLNAITLKWSFFFPFYGAGGPSFLVSFSAIAVSIIISFLMLFCAVISKKYKKEASILFIAVSFAFTLFVVQEFTFNLHSVDVSKATYDMAASYAISGKKGMLYTNAAAIPIILSMEKERVKILRCPVNNNSCWNELSDSMKSSKGAVLIVDFPKKLPDSNLKKSIEGCEFIKSFDALNITKEYRCSF